MHAETLGAGQLGSLGSRVDGLVQREGLVLGVVLLAAACLRALRWQVTAVMFNDGPVFLALAQALDRGDWAAALSHPFHPLYPALIAAVHEIVPNWEAAAVTVSILAGTAAVGAMWAFVRAGCGAVPALLAAWLLAIHPAAIEYTGDIQSEGVYLAFFVGTAAVLFRAVRDASPAWALAGGVLSGFAYLTRPEGLGLALVASAIIGVRALQQREFAPAMRFGLALCLGLGLVAAPYLGWLRAELGTWSVTQKKDVGVVIGLEAQPASSPDPKLPGQTLKPRDGGRTAREFPLETARPGMPAEPVAPEPGAWTRLGEQLAALGDVLRTAMRSLRYEGMVFLFAGLLLAGPRRPGLFGSFVLGALGLYAVVLFGLAANVGYVSGRHTLPPITLAFGAVAQGLLALGAVLASRARQPAWAGVLILVLIATGIGAGKALRPDRLEDLAERRAAEWLRDQPVPPRGVAARKRRTAWYAAAPHVKLHLHAANPSRIWAHGASHLILTDDSDDYPELRPLLDEAARVVYQTEAGGYTASVFELLPPSSN